MVRVHDLGGREGFGPVAPEESRPADAAAWQNRMFAIALCTSKPGEISADWTRYLMECIPPEIYLEVAYFERWFYGEAAGLIAKGLVSLEELKNGKAERLSDDLPPPLAPEAALEMFREGFESERPAAGTPLYQPGDPVRAKPQVPSDHCRLPGYVRGRPGRIEAFRGWHMLADAGAKGIDRAEPLYSVSFLARALWLEVTAHEDRIYLDLWESYLEPL